MSCPDPSTCTTLTVDQIKQAVINYANGYQIDPSIALAQINRESGFNPCCVGGDGERGLAQILGTTWPSVAPAGVGFDQAFDVDYNLTAWGNYMSALSGMFGGDMSKVLMAYNGGQGNVLRGNVSPGAQSYANAIIAQAPGFAASVDIANAGAGAGAGSPSSGLPMWLIIGALAVGAFVFISSRE